jgi:crotonobetainyl-CoA:carnitine CoA-transferase CaiB-like acyl-CoA transferase
LSTDLLACELSSISGGLSADLAEVVGARRWWDGPLDVEGIAVESVRSFLTLMAELTGRNDFRSSASLVYGAFQSLDLLRIDGVASLGFAAMSGFYAVADGWIRVHANYPHHARALTQALGASDVVSVRQALGDLPGVVAQERIVAAGGVAAAVRTVDSWRSQVGFSSLLRVDRTHQAPVAPDLTGPFLGGLRVVDLTRVVAGPVATRALALLGADVLRVDPPAPAELEDHYIDTAFNKRSVRLDLATSTGRDALHGLLRDAHVIVHGYRPKALDKFGLSSAALAETYPQLHEVRIQAWPKESVWSGRRGFDSIVQAATGISDLYHGADGSPGSLPVQALDHATGYAAAAAVIAAILRQQRTGHAGALTLTLADTAAWLISCPAIKMTPNLPEPQLRYSVEPGRTLRFAAPPILVGAASIDFSRMPGIYCGDIAQWSSAI